MYKVQYRSVESLQSASATLNCFSGWGEQLLDMRLVQPRTSARTVARISQDSGPLFKLSPPSASLAGAAKLPAAASSPAAIRSRCQRPPRLRTGAALRRRGGKGALLR